MNGLFIQILTDGAGMPLANVFTYFGQSNFAGKVIVLLLAVFSLVAWTVMLGKKLDLGRMRDANIKFANRLSATPNVVQIDPALPKATGPYAELTRDALAAFHRAKGGKHAISHVENALQRGVTNISLRYESKMVLLGSIVSGAPFLGLLGTVWGVMDAFGSISTESTANIGALAPGVSGALLTTVAGLLVAIPSVFGYNFLLTQTKLMLTELENFASTFADRVEVESSQND